MKKFIFLSLALGLAACQSPRLVPQAPQAFAGRQLNAMRNVQQHNAFRRFQSSGIQLKLNPALRAELAELSSQSSDEPPLDMDQNEIAQRVFQHAHHDGISAQYVHAHSQYFDVLDQGRSTVEAILAHDGHSAAAQSVARWRQVLADGAIWPDHNSTTYGGPFKPLEHGLPSANGGWFGLRNARQKAQEYYERALQAWKPNLPADHPEQEEAWAWIGRTSHFIQDLTVPFHNRGLARPAQIFFHNKYEVSVENNFETYLPSRNHNPFDVWEKGPYPQDESWGVYFDSTVSAGEMILQLSEQSSPFYNQVARSEDPFTGNWEKSRAVLVPLGAKATAGLIRNFLQNTGAM